MLQRMRKKKDSRNKAVSAHHQKQIDRIQRQCLEVKHETDRTILDLKNIEKETTRLEKLVSRYHRAIGGTTALDENRKNVQMQRSILENRLEFVEQNRTTKIKELRELKSRINRARRTFAHHLKRIKIITPISIHRGKCHISTHFKN